MKNSQESKDVRQNDTYTKSRKHEANLRRNPTLHFQIGLILSLLVAILFIEMKMPTKAEKGPYDGLAQEEPLWMEEFDVEIKQVKKVTQKQPPTPKVQQPDEFDVKKDDEKDLLEDFVNDTETDQNDIIDNNVLETTDFVDIIEDPENVPFIAIEQVPLFPGCEGLTTNQERKDCMSSKIAKLVNRKFKTEVGENLGLEGLNRIFVQFTIDRNGVVSDVRARGPRKELEIEASRVVNLLPKMTPGKQRGVPVGVIYSLPITFQLQD
ncbi:energy transducer TonB [uncultured Dokdonia sp.]|uniref:energy transducer TonB n=1 Tax=uncultured Dokdonia sp. TaxID=575653 RepID=UPI00262DE75F|nr:energy transducer TonB [uncultured Dokdonia sp.]